MSRLNEGDSAKNRVFPGDILPLIDDALTKFAKVVAEDAEQAPLLRKDYSITVTSGTGDLTASFTAAEPLLVDYLPGAYLVTSGGVQLQYLPDRTQLGLSRPSLVPYWINDKGTMRTRNTDGSLTSLSTTITLTGQFAPTITDVPFQLEDLFLDVLAEMVKARTAGAANA